MHSHTCKGACSICAPRLPACNSPPAGDNSPAYIYRVLPAYKGSPGQADTEVRAFLFQLSLFRSRKVMLSSVLGKKRGGSVWLLCFL